MQPDPLLRGGRTILSVIINLTHRLRDRHLITAATVVYVLITLTSMLTAPIDRDEHMYAAAASLSGEHVLGRDFVFTHPPLSAWWHGAALAAWPGPQVLLPLRIAQLLVVLALGGVMFAVLRRAGAGVRTAAALVILSIHLEPLRNSMGLARSHELALLLALAPWLVLPIHPGDGYRTWRLLLGGALAGLAVSTRLTHAPLTLLAVAWPALAPTTTWGGRREVVWTVLGACVSLALVVVGLRGALPGVLEFGLWDYHLLNARYHELAGLGVGMDPAGKLDHLGRYLRRTDLAAWTALVATALVLTVGWRRPWSATRWRLALGVAGCGLVMMLVPRPIQAGYDEVFLVGGAMLTAAASARLAGRPRQVLLSVLGAALLVCLVHHGADTWRRTTAALHPSRWPATAVHAAGRRLDTMLGGADGPVLTVHPLYALEAGRPIDPALSTGVFVWRLGEVLDPEVEQRLGLVTPRNVAQQVAARQPACLVAVAAAPWDGPLLDLGRGLGWQMRPLAGGVVVWRPVEMSD